MNNSELPHQWYHNDDPDKKEKASNFYYHGEVIFSYGNHFPIACKLGENTVLFNSSRFSNSTCKHVNYTLRAIPEHVNLIKTEHMPDFRFGLKAITKDQWRDVYQEEMGRIDGIVKRMSRMRVNGNPYLLAVEEINAIQDSMYALSQHVKLGYRRKPPYEANPEALTKMRAQLRKAEKALKAKNDKKASENLAAWKAGASISLYDMADVQLRIVGDEIETSKGARFPVSHAPTIWEVVKRCKSDGTRWGSIRRTIKLGIYKVDQITENGDVRAGCHFVKFPQIKEIADQLGL